MGGAILCLIVLVVLPLMSLLIGSLRGEQGLGRVGVGQDVEAPLQAPGLADATDFERIVGPAGKRIVGHGASTPARETRRRSWPARPGA